ncbi:copper resistance CopC family protein [Nocardia stercoris]|uniref:Copper resistance protein CopC n=1 Tax=Nocardia stercoris TaxID=2483361 RepID=A0A3M2L5A4_9NOCA|nr:copper resistance CopC family protein [Nocardia stercoris]RMI29718.1 copper resistance protein CopC [Nocardia stercoris]
MPYNSSTARGIGRGTRRRVPVVLAAVAAAVLGSAIGAGVADAHSHITHAEPFDGQVVADSPAEVSMTFNEKVDNPQLTVTGPDGTTVYSTGDVQVDGRTLSIALLPLDQPGTYDTHFAVDSKDGHRIEGDRTFTYAPPAN